MNYVRVQTNDLIGAELDWAVATAVGQGVFVLLYDNPEERWQVQLGGYPGGPFWPSQDWKQCGPLIEKYKIGFGVYAGGYLAVLALNEVSGSAVGADHLIAACRAIVAGVLGEAIDIPADLQP